MNITYKTRRGITINMQYSKNHAIERLAFLDQQEAITREYAPTDSGDTRFNYCAEAAALRASLS